MGTKSVRFGNISLYCAWSPASEHALGVPSSSEMFQEVVEAESGVSLAVGTQIDAEVMDSGARENISQSPSPALRVPQPHDVTPRGRQYRVEAVPITLAFWHAQRVAAIPIDGGGSFHLDDLMNIVQRLFVGAGRAAPQGVPMYFVLHVGTIDQTAVERHAWRRRQQSNQGNTGGLAGSPVLDDKTFKSLVDLVDEAATLAGIRETRVDADGMRTVQTIRDRAFFNHYSPIRRRRGFLVFDPYVSMMVDSAQEDVHNLLSLTQQATITPDGLVAATYGTVLMRVSLWDSDTDIQASLDDLVNINRSTRAATIGEVLLNLALGSASILLALLLAQNLSVPQLIYPLAISILAALAYGTFAITERKLFSRVGGSTLFAAMILALVILLYPAFAHALPMPIHFDGH